MMKKLIQTKTINITLTKSGLGGFALVHVDIEGAW